MFYKMFEVLVFIVLAVVWFFLPQACKPPVVKPANDEMPIDAADDQVDDSTPSIFIDKHLLSPIKDRFPVNDVVKTDFGSEFLIDGVVFKEKFEFEKFRDFEVFTNIKMDEYADNSCLSVDEDTPLQLYTQNAPNGVIINANVYLTHQQWNTLVVVSASTLSCAVCGVYCDETEHIKLASHKDNLDKFKPLEKYDLSITRKIDSYYHCAVCNLIFHKSQNDQHFSGKDHENKLLFAINKVSDIMYDYNVHSENNGEAKKDTYHYNAKAINNNTDDVSSDSDVDDQDSRYNVYGIKYSDDDDEDDEDFYANVEPPLNLEHSYASMARKPKTDDLPAVLEIDLGNKMVTVKFDSWHMVISPKANMFYCMVCTQYDHIRKKARHCKSDEHIKRLEQCKVIEMYEKYLVRQVDEKLYHCGHCNNLQLIHEMEDHIQSQHPATKTASFDSPKKLPSTPLKNYNKEFKTPNPHTVRNIIDVKNGNNENQPVTNGNNEAVRNGHEHVRNANANQRNVHHGVQVRNGNNSNQMTRYAQPKIGNTGKLNMYHALRQANTNINDDIVICVYGNTVRISKLAFNIVCGRDNDFYCGLCEVNINKEHLKLHVNDLQHLILLQGSPFIEAFNLHLFRQIRDALHCALCNELIQLMPEMILRHKLEPKHIFCLGIALGHIKNDIPPPNDGKIIGKPASNNTANGTTKTVAKEVDPNITAIVNTPVPKAFDENLAPLQTDQKVSIVAPEIETKEFIEVKHGVKEDVEDEEIDDLNNSMTDDTPFDVEEYLYVKMGNSYIKITNTSYHTLVEVGDGSRYCFVCSVVVNDEFKKHVDSRGHMENLEKYKFVEKYKEDLLRQIYLTYHCSICNVLITRKQVNYHLQWPTHVLQLENMKISSKQRKNEIKAGTKQVSANTQKENIYLNETDTKIKIILNIAIQKEIVVSVARKNKIVIFNDNVFKISFDFWHGLSALANGWKCKVCQCEFDGKEFASHVSSDWHKGNLEKIEKQYSPALIRKINDTTLNCIMCHTEVANKRHIIQEHIQGKKHIKNYDNILKESSMANSYADCDDDVLTL